MTRCIWFITFILFLILTGSFNVFFFWDICLYIYVDQGCLVTKLTFKHLYTNLPMRNMCYKFSGSTAKPVCRDDITIIGCDHNRCDYKCLKKHGWDAVGRCEAFIMCVCYFPCSTKKMDGRNYGGSRLPSNNSLTNVSSQTNN